MKYDLIGFRFGKLVVTCETNEKRNGCVMYRCVCDCGNVVEVRSSSLVSGSIKGCGCVRSERMKKVHGEISGDVENTKLSRIASKKIPRNNTSGVKGVSYHKSTKSWDAYLYFQKKRAYLGRFKNFDDAVKARKVAEEIYFQPILQKYEMNDIALCGKEN